MLDSFFFLPIAFLSPETNSGNKNSRPSQHGLLPSLFFFVIVLGMALGDFLSPFLAERFPVCVWTRGGAVQSLEQQTESAPDGIQAPPQQKQCCRPHQQDRPCGTIQVRQPQSGQSDAWAEKNASRSASQPVRSSSPDASPLSAARPSASGSEAAPAVR